MRLARATYSLAQTAQRLPKCNPVKKFFKATHCLFDLDEILLDTHRFYELSCTKIFKGFGKEFTPEWQRKMVMLSSKQFWKDVRETHRLPSSWIVLEKDCQDIYRSYVEGVPLRPGVMKLINHLHEHKIPMAVVTSSDREAMEAKTNHLKKFMSLFRHIVCEEGDANIKNCKPMPDACLVCASRFLEKPVYMNCLAFEGTPRGICSAIAAGMQCVAIPSQNVPHEMCQNATVVINSLAEFEPEMFGLPSFTNSEN